MNVRFSEFMELGRKYPFRGACTVLSVLAVIFSLIGWYHLSRLNVLLHKKQAEGEAVIATLISGPQTRDELAFAKDSLVRIANTLVVEENLTDNYNYFYKMEEASKARVEDVRPLNVAPAEPGALYQKIPFALKISGTYPEVAAFVQAIETGPRLASINSFNFRKRGGGPLVTADLTLDLLGKNDRK